MVPCQASSPFGSYRRMRRPKASPSDSSGTRVGLVVQDLGAQRVTVRGQSLRWADRCRLRSRCRTVAAFIDSTAARKRPGRVTGSGHDSRTLAPVTQCTGGGAPVPAGRGSVGSMGFRTGVRPNPTRPKKRGSMTGLENTNVASAVPAEYPSRRALPEAPLLAAARGMQPSHRPVWFMRQAGRSLPEYREIRAGVGMLESCFDPELVCEITMQPVRRHKVDAAILFSDIVVPLKAAGIDLDIVAGTGPVVANPVRTARRCRRTSASRSRGSGRGRSRRGAADHGTGHHSADRFRRSALHSRVLPGRRRPEP